MKKRYMLGALPVLMLQQCAPDCAGVAPSAQHVVIGDCNSYAPLFRSYGLPVETFKRIAWRESGCNHTSWVIDSDDYGGGLLGINFKTAALRAGWLEWCGARPDNNFRYNPDLQVRCAKAAYDRMGLRPWSTA